MKKLPDPPKRVKADSPKYCSTARINKRTGAVHLTNCPHRLREGETGYVIEEVIVHQTWFKTKQSADRWYNELKETPQ